MRITIKMMAVILVTILVISLTCAIVVPVDAVNDKYSPNNYVKIYCVDSETGVNYIIFQHYSTGNIAACPRYNADGSLYVTP